MSELRDDAVRWAERVMKNPEGYDSEYVNTARYILSPPAAGPGFAVEFLDRHYEAVVDWERTPVGGPSYEEMTAPFIAELLAAMGGRGDGWQPIETAPKDGAAVIVCVGLSNGSQWVGEAYYDADNRNWRPANTHHTDSHDSVVIPSHWHPLPAAPGERSGE